MTHEGREGATATEDRESRTTSPVIERIRGLREGIAVLSRSERNDFRDQWSARFNNLDERFSEEMKDQLADPDRALAALERGISNMSDEDQVDYENAIMDPLIDIGEVSPRSAQRILDFLGFAALNRKYAERAAVRAAQAGGSRGSAEDLANTAPISEARYQNLIQQGEEEVMRQVGPEPVGASEEELAAYWQKRNGVASEVSDRIKNMVMNNAVNQATPEGRRGPPAPNEIQLSVRNIYGEIPVNVENDHDGALKIFRSRIASMETRIEQFQSQNNAGAMEAISLDIRALRDTAQAALDTDDIKNSRLKTHMVDFAKRSGEIRDFSDDEVKAQAIEYLGWAEEMQAEFDARLYLHEHHLAFLRAGDTDQFKEMAYALKGRYFDIYTKFEEVEDAFILFDKYGEEYVLGREPDKKLFRNKLKHALLKKKKTLEDRKLPGGEKDKRIKYGDGLRTVDVKGNPDPKLEREDDLNGENLDFDDDSELSTEEERQIAWASNMAERIWRIWGRQALYNRIRPKYDAKYKPEDHHRDPFATVTHMEFAGDFFGGDFQMTRIMRLDDTLQVLNTSTHPARQMLKGIDLDICDFPLFAYEEFKKRFWQERTGREQLGWEGVHTTDEEKDLIKRTMDEWAEKSEQRVGLVDAYQKENPSEPGVRPNSDMFMKASQEDDYMKRAAGIKDYAQRMTPKAWRALFRNNKFDDLTDNVFYTYINYQIAGPDGVRKAMLKENTGLLINPTVDALGEAIGTLAYRGSKRMNIAKQFVQGTVMYLRHDRKEHSGRENISLELAENIIEQAQSKHFITGHQAHAVTEHLIEDETASKVLSLLLRRYGPKSYHIYREGLKVFELWDFLFYILFGILQEGGEAVKVPAGRSGGGGGGHH